MRLRYGSEIFIMMDRIYLIFSFKRVLLNPKPGAGGTWNRALEFTREDIRLQDWMVEAVLAAPAAGRGRRN